MGVECRGWGVKEGDGGEWGNWEKSSESKNDSNSFKGGCFLTKVPPQASFAFEEGAGRNGSSRWNPSFLPQAC